MEISSEEQLLALEFGTRDELLVRVRSFYSKKGYALSTFRSEPNKYVDLRCDRGGYYRNTHNIAEDHRKKRTNSRLINCPFQLRGKQHENGMWTIEIKKNEHNHEPSADISGHPSFRRLIADEMRLVDHTTNSGIPPRQVISFIRQNNPETRVISKTIYNAKAKIRKNHLGGKTMIQALFEKLGQDGFRFNVLRDEIGHITHLFFADPRSIKLAKGFSNVFVMDCTYKTNKYKMPLLDIIGITSFNSTFYAAMVFLKNESTENYVWALKMFKEALGTENQPIVIITDKELALMNAIRDVFPSTINLLCVWHINKNILAKCKKYFDTQEGWNDYISYWENVMYSSTEDEYHDRWHKFKETYQEKKLAVMYIKNSWLPLKEKFVTAWTDRHLHLGNRASSRAEGAHAKLKKYLQVSTGKQLL